MRSNLRRNTAALALLFALAACGEDTAEPKVEGGQMTARIDGQAWTASIAMAVRSSAGGIISVSGSDPSSRAIAFALIDGGTGTYEIKTGTPTNALLTVGQQQWYVGGSSQGTGTITVTTLTDERIAGTFEFTLHPANANTTGTRVVTQGKFDVKFTQS